jgi:glycerol-3-phosphate dehydrogenase (NAD+)
MESPRGGLLEEVLAPSIPPSPSSPKSKPPGGNILRLWRNAHAVCFDVDCTVAVNDGLDLLAEFMNVGKEVAALTNKAMDGSMSLEQALTARLQIINPKPSDIHAFLAAHPPESRLVPGAAELISALQSRGVAVYLISGGFRELSLPIARALGVPPKNLFANRMNWQFNDDTGAVDRLVGFDENESTGHQFGKPKVIAALRKMFPYDIVVMIGDGITDVEAVQATGGADLFIGFGGVVRRPAVVEKAEWFVDDFSILKEALKRYSVAMVGSGAWACASVRLAAQNVLKHDRFEDEIRMWVYEEMVNGRPLTEIINETHENVKYLPGIGIGANVKALSSLQETVKGADIIIICVPHQFVGGIVRQIQGIISPGAFAVSLTKGMRVRPEGPQVISELVRKELNIDCSVLMGANIASEIATDELSECTIGYSVADHAHQLQLLFETENFYVSLIPDVTGVEIAGTLKNIVALGAGFVEGLGLGYNTRASIIRAGLSEMMALAKALSPSVRTETFMEACGVGDLIASCLGGRNRLVAKTYAERKKRGQHPTFDDLEEELLKGQKLQGALTSDEVQIILKKNNWERQYPLFTTINLIVNDKLPPSAVLKYRAAAVEPKPAATTVGKARMVAGARVEGANDDEDEEEEDAFPALSILSHRIIDTNGSLA